MNVLLAVADAPLTGGSIVWTIVAGILALCGIVCIIGGVIEQHLGALLSGIAWTLCVIGLYVWTMWPLSYDYHHWIPTEGTVVRVDKRIVSTGDNSISEKYVMTFEDGRVRALNDTIGGTLREGSTAVMRCKKAYDFGVPRESHGWDCKWAGERP